MMTERISEILLENTSELVILFGERGDIRYVNRAMLEKLGYTAENITEYTMADIFRREFGKGKEPFSVAVLKEKQEAAMYRQKGSCISAQIKIFETGEGEYLLIAGDITWKKDMDLRIRQLKEEEKAALQMRDEFTANVTHELRTPVNGIRGHVSSVIGDVKDPELLKTLNLVLYCCDNVSAIINNILDFSKIKANKFLLEKREFDFYAMMEQTVAVHMAEVAKKELGLKLSIHDTVPRLVIGDSLRIGQILNNLLSNAVKFTKVGQITVGVTKTYQSGDVVELFFMVRDTGIGMTKEEQDKLFQSFVQVDASVTRNYGGTGLGLFITKQLVEMMGGNIRLDSEKGKGSCFSFNLKLNVTQEEEADEAKTDIRDIQNSWDNLIESFTEPEQELYVFGSERNRKEIEKRMEKLVLSMELGSWDKAEMLTDTIKALVGDTDPSYKRMFLRLEMAIRKEHYENSMATYQNLKEKLEESFQKS